MQMPCQFLIFSFGSVVTREDFTSVSADQTGEYKWTDRFFNESDRSVREQEIAPAGVKTPEASRKRRFAVEREFA
jgi:hypothetical protein